MTVEAARAAWRDWLKSERRLAAHTLVAYEHDVATFLGFMTGYLGKPPTLDPSDPEIIEAIKFIAKKTNEKGLIAGVHTDGPKTALTRFEQGYHFCAVLNDARLLATAAAQAIKDIRGGGKVEQAKTY